MMSLKQLASVHLEIEKRLTNKRTDVERYKSVSICVKMFCKMLHCNISRKKGDKIPSRKKGDKISY
jgi:hypothetical protein